MTSIRVFACALVLASLPVRPAFGAPVGAVLPTMQGASFDVYADGRDPLSRRAIEVEAEPPANSFEIADPELTLTDLAIVPRPFQADDAARQ